MKQHWHINPLPPPEERSDSGNGFDTFLLIAFVIIAPLIYFGPQLGEVEIWFVNAYSAIEVWVAPIREIIFG